MKTQASQVDVCKYKDSFTMFIEAVFANSDCEQAMKLIPEIEKTCEEDYFLRNHIRKIVKKTKKIILWYFREINTEEEMKDIEHKLGLDVANTGST